MATAAPPTGLPLYWRVCLTNGGVVALGAVALAASPATVSSPVLVTEALVLAVALVVVLVANAVLLRATLAPLDRLRGLMERVDLLRPGERLPEQGSGLVYDLVTAFNAMLARLEAERSASSGAALAAQEAERHRVAQELHDEVGQSLTAVLLGLRRLADRVPAELHPEVALAAEAARTSLDEVRQVAQRLRPGVLEDLGLASALTSLATEHARLTGADVTRRITASLPPLDPRVELVVYRVAQEALTNVARHAGAARVELRLELDGGARGSHLVLQVLDDGRGVRSGRESSGVRGMRERALLVGADLALRAREEGGTALRLAVPLPRAGAGR